MANVHDDPYETLGVLICGFPFGDDLKEGRGRGNPEVTIGNGSVSSLRHDDSGKLRLVQIDGDLNPGNSGGPVVDKRGRLVGIAVATIERSSIGFAIPAKDLLRLLYGRALDPSLYPVRKDGNSLELIAMVPLADPFEQIRSVSLHRGTVAETESLMRKAKKTGEWPLLPKLKDVHFERKGRTAQARVQIQPQRSGDVLQVSYVNGEGKTIVTEPVVFELASVQPPPGGIQMPDITTPQAQGLTVEMMNQFPERYLAKSVTVKARMYGGVVGRGELRML